jgi:hypothetical protein
MPFHMDPASIPAVDLDDLDTVILPGAQRRTRGDRTTVRLAAVPPPACPSTKATVKMSGAEADADQAELDATMLREGAVLEELLRVYGNHDGANTVRNLCARVRDLKGGGR